MGEDDDVPEYVPHRQRVWDAVVERRRRDAADEGGQRPIAVTLIVGSEQRSVRGVAHHSTARALALEELGAEHAPLREALVAQVDSALWDLERPLESDCTVRLLGFESPEGKSVFWHSTAHMLGEAMEALYHGELCIGPPVEDGFYYDMFLGERAVSEEDFKELEGRIERIARSRRTFQRLELHKSEAREMFQHNRFKLEIIDKLEAGMTITAYRDGPFIDLCKGPHVPNSAAVRAVMVRKTGQAYWLGDAANASLQRVYGVSFPDKKALKEYKHMLAEAARRDHRLIGKRQELFFFSPLSPGSAFLLPHGARIYSTLVSFVRDEYWKRGYEEVQTPNIYDFALWETSGHAANYRANMFGFEVEGRECGLKPMNCPGHCVLFGSRVRSYRELPLRLAEFGVLHRNELSGTLSGLTRVRRFVQDDAHIFCTPEQVSAEVEAYLIFMKDVYDVFGFRFELELSTRPEKHYLGSVAEWDAAEAELRRALDRFAAARPDVGGWRLNPGDGAFYGPKIDIKLFDALQRRHQCATVQLDFQLPRRFKLEYRTSAQAGGAGGDGEAAPPAAAAATMERPVIIHRAIFGSLERFLAVLIEHYEGRWPFWLSPRQVIVLPVSEKTREYAQEVRLALLRARLFVDVDTSDRKLAKKIREAEIAQYNLIAVVGEAEQRERTVNVRAHAGAPADRIYTIDQLRECCERMRDPYFKATDGE